MEDDWDLTNMKPPGVVDVQSSLREIFLATQKEYLYGLEVPANAGGGFCIALKGPITLDEHFQALK